MPKRVWAQCPTCLHREPLDRPGLTCPACGSEWLDAAYEYEPLSHSWRDRIAARPFSLWRYWDLLPLRDAASILTMGEGGTPLVHATNLGMMLGRSHIYIKDERQGPTGAMTTTETVFASTPSNGLSPASV